MNIKIEQAKLSDVADIIKIGKSIEEFKISKGTITFWPKKILINCVKDKNNLILLAKQNEELIGFIIANYNPIFEKAIIENILVKKDFRNKGVGKLLLDSLLLKLKRLGCSYICSLTEIKNKNTIKFYIKNKFNKGKDFVWLDKALSNSFKQ